MLGLMRIGAEGDRRERDTVETTLAERGLTLIVYADRGPGRGMEFGIGVTD